MGLAASGLGGLARRPPAHHQAVGAASIYKLDSLGVLILSGDRRERPVLS